MASLNHFTFPLAIRAASCGMKRILHGVVRGKAGGGFAGAYIVSTCDFVKRNVMRHKKIHIAIEGYAVALCVRQGPFGLWQGLLGVPGRALNEMPLRRVYR